MCIRANMERQIRPNIFNMRDAILSHEVLEQLERSSSFYIQLSEPASGRHGLHNVVCMKQVFLLEVAMTAVLIGGNFAWVKGLVIFKVFSELRSSCDPAL